MRIQIHLRVEERARKSSNTFNIVRAKIVGEELCVVIGELSSDSKRIAARDLGRKQKM